MAPFLYDGPRKRLSEREIDVLRRLARLSGGRAITLPPYLHWHAIQLWHREVVEIWYQQKHNDQPSLRGPFFTLTISGMMLATGFIRDGDVATVSRGRRRPIMRVRDYDPGADGQDFQGDVSIIRIPSDISISTIDQIAPVEGRLILQAGEASGHHHAINLPRRQFRRAQAIGDPVVSTRSSGLRRHFASKAPETNVGTARLYRDPTVAPEMVRRRILTRSDLAICCLVVEGGPIVISHEEHDGIRVQPGNYLIGGQVESVGAEERRVLD